jgi:hypothetical protein
VVGEGDGGEVEGLGGEVKVEQQVVQGEEVLLH